MPRRTSAKSSYSEPNGRALVEVKSEDIARDNDDDDDDNVSDDDCDDDDDDDDDDNDEEDEEEAEVAPEMKRGVKGEEGSDDDDDDDDGGGDTGGKIREKRDERSFIRKEAERFSEKLRTRGVIYVSRVPPFMKPNKLRTLLEVYGEITRLYLAEEDPSVRKRRKARGGNGSKQFVEGWVEFAEKRVARRVARSLNNTQMGGKKRDYYHDDIWNLKYLKNFKWDHLTEKFSYERRVRESKLKAAMMQAKRQNAEFVEMLDKDETYQHIKKRKLQRSGEADDKSASGGQQQQASSGKRSFKQLKGSGEFVRSGNRKEIGEGVVQAIFSEGK